MISTTTSIGCETGALISTPESYEFNISGTSPAIGTMTPSDKFAISWSSFANTGTGCIAGTASNQPPTCAVPAPEIGRGLPVLWPLAARCLLSGCSSAARGLVRLEPPSLTLRCDYVKLVHAGFSSRCMKLEQLGGVAAIALAVPFTFVGFDDPGFRHPSRRWRLCTGSL